MLDLEAHHPFEERKIDQDREALRSSQQASRDVVVFASAAQVCGVVGAASGQRICLTALLDSDHYQHLAEWTPISKLSSVSIGIQSNL